MFWYFIRDINPGQRLFLDWELLEQINVINILFTGRVVLEAKQWFLTLKFIYVFDFISLDCRQRLLEYFFWVIS